MKSIAVALLALCVVGNATSGITPENYQNKRTRYVKIQDHAEDTLRFFANHTKPAHSKIGKRVVKTQGKAHRWSTRKLDQIERFVYSGEFLPWKWRDIIRCETHTNWRHNSGNYQGAFGFAVSSWDRFNSFGFPSEAYLATPEQQYRVALAIYARYGYTGWGCA